MASSLFMSWEDKVKVWGVVDGIEHGQDGAARIADWRCISNLETGGDAIERNSHRYA
jgi:hypothetical protein